MSLREVDGLGPECQIDSKMTSQSEVDQEIIASNGKPAYQPSETRKAHKMMTVEVHFLDDSIKIFQIQYKATGRVLFDEVCKILNLLEVDYFGLEYMDARNTKHWLDYEKLMCRQTGLSSSHPKMYFLVKFFTPDPAQLEEEYTRYLFSLQIKKNLADGMLQCNDNTAALMASYIVQAECGDYAPEDYPDHTYLSCYKFVPYQNDEFQKKIMENHKKHIGQSPAEADLNLLETARRCELYGIQMTPAKDHEGVQLNLAVAHMGILVFQNYTKINTFSWAKVRKLSFKRKRFLIKLLPEGYGYYKDIVEFFFDHRNDSKNFWKKCIENHAFFRCAEVKRISRQKPRFFSRGSSFRYSGRTQKQIVEYVRENYVQRCTFQRSISLRVSSTTDNNAGTMGNSISAQPLIPVTTSQSCGSVVLLTNEKEPDNQIKQFSHSEPPSPFSIADCGLGTTNGSVNEDKSEANLSQGISQHDSPEAENTGGGLCSPDYLGQDTDDNISHDSYQLEEKEAVVSESNAQSSSDDIISTNIIGQKHKILSVAPLGNGLTKEVVNEIDAKLPNIESEVCEENKCKILSDVAANGDIRYVLHRRQYNNDLQIDTNIDSPTIETSRIRVDHPIIGQVSPNLFARANRLNVCNTSKEEPKNIPLTSYNQTVDFVYMNYLPSVGNYSSHDDSMEEGSLEKEIFEQLRKKKFFEIDQINVLEEKPIEKDNTKLRKPERIQELPNEINLLLGNSERLNSVQEKDATDVSENEIRLYNLKTKQLPIQNKKFTKETVLTEEKIRNTFPKEMIAHKPSKILLNQEKPYCLNRSISDEPTISDINKVSDSCLQETLLVLNEEDIIVDDEDRNESHVETVFLEINQNTEDTVSMQNHYTYSCYKFLQEGSIEEWNTNNG